MPKQKKTDPSQYIPIAHADDIGLAEDCMKLLRESEISAKIQELKKRTCLLLVQEGRFNEAYIIIHSHLSPDGFFSMYSEQTHKINDPNQAA